MEEFSGLAARVAASVSDLRGCLVLDRDGLVLGAYPEGQEAAVKSAWLRFAGLGEADKGFVEFGDVLWAYVRRGPYAAFAVSGTQARPGFVMDQLEQILLTAEEVRAKRDALRVPEVAPAPSSRPRTPLHPEPRAAPPADVQPAPAAAQPTAPPARPPTRPAPPAVAPVSPPRAGAAPTSPTGPPGVRPSPAPVRPASGPPAAPTPAPGPAPGPEAPRPSTGRPPPKADEEHGEVDPVLLAQEFSRLLQETGDGDEV
jgi:hypothetical protein